MKYPVIFKNHEELGAIMRLSVCAITTIKTPQGKLVEAVLKELQEKLLKKTLNCALSQTKKGKLNLTRAELLAIAYNYQRSNFGPYEQGIYNKSITPLLHVLA